MRLVGENILALNQKFWLRMASRADAADAKMKEKISALSKAIMTITDALVKMTDSQLVDSSALLTEILTAAADENGHWHVPLAPDKEAALKAVIPFSHSFEFELWLSGALGAPKTQRSFR